jgi:hypothetical protein
MSGASGKQTRGDYPILGRDRLPVVPSQRGIFDPLAAFMGAVQDAYSLGIAPPKSIADVLAWRAKTSPLVEQRKTDQANLRRLSIARIVGI